MNAPVSPGLCRQQHSLTLEAAQRAVQAAVAAAQAQGLLINVAVVDASGVLLAFARMPGAFLHSIDIAQDKAYTAASFGFPTSQWAPALAGDELLRQGLGVRPRLVLFGGGLPIDVDLDGKAQRLGAIGVSGASAEQDEACARAGLAALHDT